MRFRLPVACALALLFASFTRVAAAQDAPLGGPEAESSAALAPLPPLPPPPVDSPPPGARANHILAGIGVTAVGYGLAVAGSYLTSEYPGEKQLRIPVVGPWMAVARTGCPADEPDCSPFGLAFGAALVIFDGIVQAGGLAIIGEGLFLRTSSRPAPAPKKAAHLSVRAVPLDFGKRGLGLGFAGTF
ncbi:MAG TPA: hypothetical protein VIW29_13965 [Polyangiaceae bacterium]